MLPQLTTERLLLQAVTLADQPFVFEGLSHPLVTAFYGVRYATLEATKAQIDWYEKLVKNETGGAWKMVEKASGDALGVIAVYNLNAEHQKAELGFWLLPAYWNKGFASEAVTAVVGDCVLGRNLHRLEAFVEAGNSASGRVLEKAGFQCEGKMRDCEIKDGRFISLFVYGLLLG